MTVSPHSLVMFSPESLGWRCSETPGFRHVLRRDFAEGNRLLVAIGFNPSTATEFKHDATTRTLERIAQRHSYSSWAIVNVFDRRATNPIELRQHSSWRSDKWREEVADQGARAEDILAMWGTLPRKFKALSCASETLAVALESASRYGRKPRVLAIGTTGNGDPRHILYTRNDATMTPWDISSCHDFEMREER